jgi:hypothetical protein
MDKEMRIADWEAARRGRLKAEGGGSGGKGVARQAVFENTESWKGQNHFLIILPFHDSVGPAL